MGWTESDSACKKHPTHNQHQGVCPSCLRERLSVLCASSRRESSIVVVPSFSASPYYSSPGSAGRHSRNPSVGALMSSVMVSGGNRLKKSRSIAFVNARSCVVDENGNKKKKTTTKAQNKKGFWSNLLGLKGKDKGILMHSRSIRERLT